MKLSAPTFAALLLAAPLVHAKLPPPPPLPPDAQAKADEAKAKATWSDKVAAFQLCRSMDRVADVYLKTAKAAHRDIKPPVATPPCSDPGPFAAAAPATQAPGTKK